MTGEPTRAFSQKADLLEVFRWEPSTYFTNLQAEVAEEIVLFLRNNGKDTGQETYTHWRSGDVWRLVRVSPQRSTSSLSRRSCAAHGTSGRL